MLSFQKRSLFCNSEFSEEVYIGDSSFRGKVNFKKSKFLGKKVHFGNSDFFEVSFVSAEFSGVVNFVHSTFHNEAKFNFTKFCKDIDFTLAKFLGKTRFQMVKFLGKTDFDSVTFSKEVKFINTVFSEEHQTIFTDTKFNFIGRDLKSKYVIFKNIIFTEKSIFRRCDLSLASFLDSDLEKANFENCDFWQEKDVKKIWDEETLNNKSSFSDYKNVERLYVQLQENFANKGEISESFPFVVGKIRLAEKRIEKQFPSKIEKEKNDEQKEFLFAEMKKRYDDLTLYNYGDEYYKQEFDVKNRSKKFNPFSWLNWYKWISNYNTSPTKAFWILFVLSILSIFVYWGLGTHYNTWEVPNLTINLADCSANCQDAVHNRFTWETATSCSITSAIPLLIRKFPIETEKLAGGIMYFHYFQVIFSTIIWTLLILSIRRKFKR